MEENLIREDGSLDLSTVAKLLGETSNMNTITHLIECIIKDTIDTINKAKKPKSPKKVVFIRTNNISDEYYNKTHELFANTDSYPFFIYGTDDVTFNTGITIDVNKKEDNNNEISETKIGDNN